MLAVIELDVVNTIILERSPVMSRIFILKTLCSKAGHGFGESNKWMVFYLYAFLYYLYFNTEYFIWS